MWGVLIDLAIGMEINTMEIHGYLGMDISTIMCTPKVLEENKCCAKCLRGFSSVFIAFLGSAAKCFLKRWNHHISLRGEEPFLYYISEVKNSVCSDSLGEVICKVVLPKGP
jgi:hypothetical protein